MLDPVIRFFLSAFTFPDLAWQALLTAIGLGIAFGAVWLAAYHPSRIVTPRLWLIGLVSALFTWVAVAFVQIPLQLLTGQALHHFWNQIELARWLLLAGIPQILLSGLVQEAAKLLPVAVYWWRRGKAISPRTGLVIGAISGAGFGIFEAIWVHNTIFASGWTWQAVSVSGFSAVLGFLERFFCVSFHIGACALAGYGLATRRGWRFYLLAALLHAVMNYSVALVQKGILTSVQVEIYIAVVTLAITAWVLWLRWRPETNGKSNQTIRHRVQLNDSEGQP
jgi:RsiW-degrading membrane proteinase PrsW (M82 family)